MSRASLSTPRARRALSLALIIVIHAGGIASPRLDPRRPVAAGPTRASALPRLAPLGLNLRAHAGSLNATAPPAVTTFSPTGGPTGSLVTITGANLDGVTDVTFNGVTAPIMSDSGTQVTATVPAGATTGPIKVTTSAGNVSTTATFIVTTAANPIDDSKFYVREHYRAFLNREPDASGLAFWTNEIEKCNADQQCRDVRRINVSAAFFLSIEFQQTGYLVYRLYKAAFGNLPNKPVPVQRANFLADTIEISSTPAQVIVGQGDWQAQLETNKVAFTRAFVQRAAFKAAYPQGMAAATYVNALFAKAGVTPTTAERQAAIAAYGTGDTAGRAAALRAVAENTALQKAEFNKAFVLMQYFGYLHRDPDAAPDTNYNGFNFWLGKLNQFHGDFIKAEMVKAFISSTEYRAFFIPPTAPPLGATSLSSNSALPMTPLRVNTQGLALNLPVTVRFSNAAGFSQTETPFRIDGDGTVLLGTPIYLDPHLHQLGAGTVSVVLTQSGKSTAPLTLGIQELPPLSTYGTPLGEITHYKLIMDAQLVAQKINRLQAFEHLPGDPVSTFNALQTLHAELKQTIQYRSDVDRVMKDNSLSIDTGADSADGTRMKFDKDTLDMMDRVNALFLLQTYGALPPKSGAPAPASMLGLPTSSAKLTQRQTAAPGAAAPVRYARVVTRYKRNRSLPKPLGVPRRHLDSASATTNAASAFEQFLVGLGAAKNVFDHTVTVTGAALSKDWVDITGAMAKSAAVLMDFTKTNIEFGAEQTVLSKKLGLYGAILGNITTIANALSADAAYIWGWYTDNPALQEAALEDLSNEETQRKNWGALIDIVTGGLSAAFPDTLIQKVADTTNGFSSLWFTSKEAMGLLEKVNGESPVEEVLETTDDAVRGVPAGEEDDFGVVDGQADVTTNLGDQAPPSGIDLSKNGIDFETLADPTGDFEAIVPLGVPGFDYGHVDVDIFDPLTDTTLGSETVDLTGLAGSTAPLVIPPVQGVCFDDDINTPDGDDPDCD